MEKLAEYEAVYWDMAQTCGESTYLTALNRSFLRIITIYVSRLYRSGYSTQTIADLLNQSGMVQAVLAEPTESIKDALRAWMLRLKQYRLCGWLVRN